jgi:hypothetical protein
MLRGAVLTGSEIKLPCPANKVWGSRGLFQMCRYYFHVKRGQLTVLDNVGVELVNIGAAWREAKRRAQKITSLENGSSHRGMIVIDDDWRTVMEVAF